MDPLDRNRMGTMIINKHVTIKQWLNGAPQSGFTPQPATIISSSPSKPYYLHRVQVERENRSRGEWMTEA